MLYNLNFCIIPHLYSVYHRLQIPRISVFSQSSSNSFTQIFLLLSTQKKSIVANNGVRPQRSSCFLRACPDPRKRKGKGKNISAYIHIYIYIQRTKGNNSTARRSSPSFKIVSSHGTKELKDLRQCDKCSCAMFGCVLSSCCSQMEASKERFSVYGRCAYPPAPFPLPTYQRMRVFLRAFTIRTR